MELARRGMLRAVLATGGVLALPTPALAAAGKVFAPHAGPRSRVIYVNDLSGDLDGLFATAHMILSNGIDLRGIVGSTEAKGKSARSVELAQQMLKAMGRAGSKGPAIPVYQGSDDKLAKPGEPSDSPGARAIIAEARRSDSPLPLTVAVGGGLTEVASALMLAPDIADRFTLIWIGGGPLMSDLGNRPEANFGIDPIAARHVFNDTSVRIWQVPSDVYKTCVVSASELQANVAPHGAIGAWLYERLLEGVSPYRDVLNTGETWTLGDNPLVVLAALADWVPSGMSGSVAPGAPRPRFSYERTGSSSYDDIVAPRLDEMGRAVPQTEGRRIRYYRSIDTRLMFGDFFAKLRLNYPAGRR